MLTIRSRLVTAIGPLLRSAWKRSAAVIARGSHKRMPGGRVAHNELQAVSDPEPLQPRLRNDLPDPVPMPLPSKQPEVLVLQSADPYHYFDMLVETSRTVRHFCQTNGFRYQCVIGIKRGYYSWHATFNRIILLKELIASGYLGWVFYIDADAYIADQTFDLRAYLEEK